MTEDPEDVEERPAPTTIVACHARIWTPIGDGTPLDLHEMVVYLRLLRRMFRVSIVRFDPHMFQYQAQILSDEGAWMEEFPQTDERMAPASMRTYDLIVTQAVEHDGHPLYADHMAAAATKPVSDRSWRITKRGATGPMDACVSTVMAAPLAAEYSAGVGIE